MCAIFSEYMLLCLRLFVVLIYAVQYFFVILLTKIIVKKNIMITPKHKCLAFCFEWSYIDDHQL